MQINSNDTILLIDGSSFIFRAFHAIPELSSPNGHPTNATYGVVNMLKQLKKRIPTNHIACIFDAPGKNFRDEMYPAYKATRRETPEKLTPQFADIYKIVEALGIPLIMQSGIEADDIIGTLAIHAKNNNKKVLIATGDKDFAQLVDNDVTLINTMTNEVLDFEGVIKKFEVKPSQIVDYLALVGDKVDNVPGVEKCGPKTAVKWLTEYQTLENLMANSNKIAGVVGENLRKTLEWLPTAKKLVTINTNIGGFPIDEINNLVYKTPDNKTLETIYQNLGFRTWLKEITENHCSIESEAVLTNTSSNPKLKAESFDDFQTREYSINKINVAIEHKIQSNPNNSHPADVYSRELDCHSSGCRNQFTKITKNVIKINSTEQLKGIVDDIINKNNLITLLAIGDSYPTPLDIKQVLIGTADTSYIVINEVNPAPADLFAPNSTKNNKSTAEILRLLRSNTPKLFIHYKDFLQLFTITTKNLDLKINAVIGDLTLLHYIKNSKLKHVTSMIYKDVIGLDVIDLPSINTKYTKDSVWHDNTSDIVNNKLLEIIDNAPNLESILLKSLDEEEFNLYKNIELPLAAILVDIENVGVKLDVAGFKVLETELSLRLKILEDKIYQDSGVVFNINSPKQLQEVLFETLKLPTLGIKKNTNAFSTDEDTLKILEEQGITIATYLLEYRALSKLLNTYVNKLPIMVDSNHRVHTTFEQALVASGRLSSNNPNLQNIPIKSDWGKRIRQAFIAKPGTKLICADYSQIELRILAHISQDENLISAFNLGLDIHTKTACDIFHKTEDSVTKDERRYAKTINFSLLYGKTVFGLAQELNIDRVTAKSYIDAYFAKYPKIMQCLNEIKQFGHNHGYVRTVFGRRIYLPNINATNRMLREAEERLALNAPMQGTSADIIKIAMCNLHKWLEEQRLKTKIILQVHDELILEAPDDEIEVVAKNLNEIMANAVNLSVKLGVDVKIANNWDEAH